MPHAVYNIIHLTGLVMVFFALGGLTLHGISGGDREFAGRKLAMITHGIGLSLALLGGFGLLARVEIAWVWPGWVFVKTLIWLILGGAVVLALRVPRLSTPLWWGSILLAGIATYLANYQPF